MGLYIFLKGRSIPQHISVCSVKIQDQKNMPQIILKERTAHVGSYTYFTSGVDQY